MPTIFLKHSVENYEVWRAMYAADLERREAAGVKEIGVFRDTIDENTVLLVLEVEDLATAKSLLDPALMALMRDAGVLDTQVWIADIFGRHVPLSFRNMN